MKTNVLILGAGPAGYYAAKAAAGRAQAVILVGAEEHPPCRRPRLLELLVSGDAIDKGLIESEGELLSRGITFLPLHRVVSIDSRGQNSFLAGRQ